MRIYDGTRTEGFFGDVCRNRTINQMDPMNNNGEE
jgi:hypothetical protein